jgi:Heterokaryon incompatibility protein (HET)
MSYTWGDSKHVLGILVDGKWLNVTRDVYELLQDRASSYESRSHWIDCICINQTDDDVKSSQISMMHDIYRQATRVIIWLGLSSDTVQAFSLLEDLYQRLFP